MLKSIIAAAICGAFTLRMSDADAGAPARALYFNQNTNTVFLDDANRAAEDGIRQIQSAEVDGLRSNGATVEQPALDYLNASNANSDQAAVVQEGNAVSDPASGASVSDTPDAATVSESTSSTSPTSTDTTGSKSSSSTDDAGNANAPAASSTSATAAADADSAPPASSVSATSASVTPASATDQAAADQAALAEHPNPGVAFEPVDTSTGPSTGELTAAASAPVLAEVPVDDANTPIDQNTGKVVLDANNHVEAKDRFAGLMAMLHQFEEDSVDKLKEELRAIGTLLHLHSTASSNAEHTGDYRSSDLS